MPRRAALTSARLAEERASPRPKLTSLLSRSLARAHSLAPRQEVVEIEKGERDSTENKTKPTRLIYVSGKVRESFQG